MSLATDLQDDIAELLNDPDVGRAVTISRTPGTAYDPSTGAVTSGTPQTFTTRGLFLDYKDSLIDGTNVKRGDRRLYLKIKGISYVAAIGDTVVAGTDRYAVVNFKTIELGGAVVIFILQVRK